MFGYEDESYYPLYISKDQKDTHVNLLLIQNHESSHYCLIKNLNKMLSSENKHNGETFFCTHCLHGFSRKDLLLKHQSLCQIHGLLYTELPDEKNKWMKFTNIKKMLKVPYVTYADFELILNKSDDKNTIHKHRTCGYSYLVVSSVNNKMRDAVVYRGKDAVEHFLKNITKEVNGLMKHIQNTNIPMMLSEEDEPNFKQATKCFICEEELEKDGVQDHCHLTGIYRGAVHSNCNLQFQYSNQIPIFFHNLEGYDSHLIMQHLGKYKHLLHSKEQGKIHLIFCWECPILG